ncbi:DUF1189 family protein [Candidatus Woesearchaeota archaeon]|nr:DUF1189 family protein [Candidatus Woesearchaeota archaeon]
MKKDGEAGRLERVSGFLKEMLLSFYPKAYWDFSKKSPGKAFRYIFNVVLVSAIIALALLLFGLSGISISLGSELDKFEKLNITGEIELREPVSLHDDRIIIANEKMYEGEDLLITKENITRKPLLCLVFRPYCWFNPDTTTTGIDEFSNIDAYRECLKTVIIAGLFIAMPGIVMLYLAYILLKAAIFVVAASLLGYVATFLTKHRIGFRQVLAAAIYSSTFIIIAEPFNIMVKGLYYIHVLISGLLFINSIVLLCRQRKVF